MFAERVMACLVVVAVLAGCASRPINQPIAQVDPTAGYRFSPKLQKQKREEGDSSTLFILSFSGGGTRAAAFSYGVLEELRRTNIVVNGRHRRLVDEVDLITAVSGGSFTALAYALHGERLFAEYEERFLKRDVQGALSRRALNPFNWWKFIGGSAGRSELAAEYYDEILFERATFGDLIDKPGPVAIATSTDISTGARLAFFQNDFDLLCSDLSKVRLSRAAAASSAVPVVLSVLTFDNYGGTCGFEYPAWVRDLAESERLTGSMGRAMQRYRAMESFQNSKDRPYIHVVDGGVSDNIGVRGVIEVFEQLTASAAFRKEAGVDAIRRIVLIIVNARSSPRIDWDRNESPPGFVSQLLRASGVPIDRYSFETIEMIKERAALYELAREMRVQRARRAGGTPEAAEASLPKLTLQVLAISFDDISDPDERAHFQNLPTSFVLPAQDIDRLRELAGRLMRESPQYEAIVRGFGGGPGR